MNNKRPPRGGLLLFIHIYIRSPYIRRSDLVDILDPADEHRKLLVFRERDCLVFVEVKTRSSEDWTRPAAAVNARKKKLLSGCALDYLQLLKNPEVKMRFDIVEVLLKDGTVDEIRHLPNTFVLSKPYRYG